MKCEKCSKPATFHITDLARGKYQEFHFCDEHARIHLSPNQEATGGPPKATIDEIASKLTEGVVASPREPSSIDQKSCPVCQITFGEFRNTGRLGCPYDYEVFRDELMPLLENIHEDTRHVGKLPHRAPRDPKLQTRLISLRNDLKRAVAAEDYEEAARIRDQIRSLELELGR